MPRYFFDTHNGDHLIRDPSGTELPNRETARLEAQTSLGLMAKDEMPDGDARNLYVNVKNEDGVPIYTVCMSVIGQWLA